MGVVRDVTVDNLVTAVGNIDTSSLAQDSTLQDVATAIGNISGGSDPVTNTTVNSLCKDSTGQSIASAISGLGQTLGADKANISGDNIASPAVFRQNIGAINLVVLSALVEVSFQDTSSIGYRTTEQTKVAVSSLSGYPTGRTIVGMIAQATYLYGGEAFVDDSGYIRACTKASTANLPVKVLCFYL